jgi:hypothetical protein
VNLRLSNPEHTRAVFVTPRCRHFRNKKKEYLKAKIEELETNSKIENVRGA